MDKITYLAELAEGLARWVPERERQDILRYYAEYFEEAGPGREAEVVAELGDPWALSCRLAVEGGYVTQERAMSWTPRKTWPRVLIGTAVGLLIFTLVSGFGLMAFNVMRTVSGGLELTNAVAIASEAPMVGQWADGTVTIIDSGYVHAEEGMALEEFRFIEDGSLEAFYYIDADISLGNIEVVYADSYTLSINRSEAMSGYDLTWEVRDGVLRLRDGGGPQVQMSSWDDLKNIFGVGRQTVEITITVPEGAALDNINVETGLGDVLVWGVNAETVTAETGLGNIGCYEVRNVRKLRLNAGRGDVGLGLEEVRSGLDIDLESGMGNVEVSLGCSESDCQYEMESGLSLVTVNGVVRGSKAERKGNMPCRLVAESGTGSVSVYFDL